MRMRRAGTGAANLTDSNGHTILSDALNDFYRLNYYGKNSSDEGTIIQTMLTPGNGANVNATDSKGNNMLQEVILEAGALQKNGENPDEEMGVANELIADGASTTSTNNAGQTALQMAQKEGLTDFVNGLTPQSQSTTITAAALQNWFTALSCQSNDGNNNSISKQDLLTRIKLGSESNEMNPYADVLLNNFSSLSQNGTISLDSVLNADLPTGQSMFKVTDNNVSQDVPTGTTTMTSAQENTWYTGLEDGDTSGVSLEDLAKRFIQGTSTGSTPVANVLEQEFSTLDTDHNGELSLAEIAKATVPGGTTPLITVSG